MRSEGSAPVSVRALSDPVDTMAQDVLAGLSATPKWLSPKYFYDERGSELFAAITELPEYYPTRTELGLLEEFSDEIMESVNPSDVIELGSGASLKARLLLDSLGRLPGAEARRYVPKDISEAAVTEAVQDLCEDYPWLRIDGLVGDFFEDLHRIERHGPRLVSFLGSTIGNFEEADRAEFLAEVASMLAPGDRFLLGVDLVKPESVLLPAYDDAQGTTAEFNLNVLRAINRDLGSTFDEGGFVHVAEWDHQRSSIDMFLEAKRDMTVEIARLDLEISLTAGERIHTEQSAKFERSSVESFLEAEGLTIDRWFTDSQRWFALALIRVA